MLSLTAVWGVEVDEAAELAPGVEADLGVFLLVRGGLPTPLGDEGGWISGKTTGFSFRPLNVGGKLGYASNVGGRTASSRPTRAYKAKA